MVRLCVLLILSLVLFGCKNYENKTRYEVSVGETFEIYYSTNSCCHHCFSNEKNLKHIRLVDNKMVDPDPEDCDGCNYTAALVFVAESTGFDTVKSYITGATTECDSISLGSVGYIIEIK